MCWNNNYLRPGKTEGCKYVNYLQFLESQFSLRCRVWKVYIKICCPRYSLQQDLPKLIVRILEKKNI